MVKHLFKLSFFLYGKYIYNHCFCRVLCETVKDFMSKISVLSSVQGDEDFSEKCQLLKAKLDRLLQALKEEQLQLDSVQVKICLKNNIARNFNYSVRFYIVAFLQELSTFTRAASNTQAEKFSCEEQEKNVSPYKHKDIKKVI